MTANGAPQAGSFQRAQRPVRVETDQSAVGGLPTFANPVMSA
jgi:hypothetical protein